VLLIFYTYSLATILVLSIFHYPKVFLHKNLYRVVLFISTSTRCTEFLAEAHPTDAKTLGMKDGQFEKVTSRLGAVQAKSTKTEHVPKGIIFMNFHFWQAAINVLTNLALDSLVKIRNVGGLRCKCRSGLVDKQRIGWNVLSHSAYLSES
jgi:hypothetical protein